VLKKPININSKNWCFEQPFFVPFLLLYHYRNNGSPFTSSSGVMRSRPDSNTLTSKTKWTVLFNTFCSSIRATVPIRLTTMYTTIEKQVSIYAKKKLHNIRTNLTKNNGKSSDSHITKFKDLSTTSDCTVQSNKLEITRNPSHFNGAKIIFHWFDHILFDNADLTLR